MTRDSPMNPPVQQEYIITASQLEEMWTQCESRYFDEMRDAIRSRPAQAATVDCDGDCLSCNTEVYINCPKRINPQQHQPPASPDNALLDEIISFCESKRSISPLPFHEGERCIIDWILSTAEMRGYKHRQSQPGGDIR